MAGRFHEKEDDLEGQQPTPGPVSSTGIIKLQPNRKNIDRTWRPVPASDLEKYSTAARDARCDSSTAGRLLLSNTTITSLMDSRYDLSTEAFPILESKELSENHTDRSGDPIETSRASNNEYCPNFSRSFAGDHYGQLFGKLPDPICLHEEMGEFDGQVIFIGHPNRDVSAHQWSSASFQWVNIGRYAHSRSKVEGSLASDRLKENCVSHDPLAFFKSAAENREKLIVENGRTKEVPSGALQSAPANGARTASLSTASDPIVEKFPGLIHNNVPSNPIHLEDDDPLTSMTLQASVGMECLEDPFVAPTESSTLSVGPSLKIGNDRNDPKGSLDLGYAFPLKPGISAVSDHSIRSTSQNLILEGKRNHHEIFTGLAHRQLETALRDINLGEDAAGGHALSSGRSFLSRRTPLPASSENTWDNRTTRDRLAELSDLTLQPSGPGQEGIALPTYTYVQPEARSLHHPPGLTVANPHRIVSSLNASAPTYANMRRLTPGPKSSAFEAMNFNATAATLRFSDPDGLRQSQEYEIANGLGHQAPTVQCFKGPFFTDSKPTTSDPTVSLSVPIGEEEKLYNWFRDGHRPSRQQEYAKTLISAAAPSNRCRSLGAVGEAFGGPRDRYYENTSPFIRLYESLSEYLEEYSNGSGRSYFTRAWKPAAPRLRDLDQDGNNSYFHGPTDILADPKAAL
ncbi:hypothetical protein N0V83_002604 [Neocucurbitaria cava]|uniref:Uncharacterized protein n=1 Tax=Neocucurbitaria cava TaxID=798079 RepID=A0A9W8YBU6_9PLEO|nr:hypothetical protein N0V83_002604 [Neocucurbitaria cava]